MLGISGHFAPRDHGRLEDFPVGSRVRLPAFSDHHFFIGNGTVVRHGDRPYLGVIVAIDRPFICDHGHYRHDVREFNFTPADLVRLCPKRHRWAGGTVCTECNWTMGRQVAHYARQRSERRGAEGAKADAALALARLVERVRRGDVYLSEHGDYWLSRVSADALAEDIATALNLLGLLPGASDGSA